MVRWDDLAREYENRRFPLTRRLSLHGEGPGTAPDRALRWIQSYAHEEPGSELLLLLERHTSDRAVWRAVEHMLDRITPGLLAWWQPFSPGSIALRIADVPRLRHTPTAAAPPDDPLAGRTPETAGAAYLEPEADVPPILLPLANRAAELRREREGGSTGVAPLLLRRVWLEAQGMAMMEGITFEQALARIVHAEEELAYDEEA